MLPSRSVFLLLLVLPSCILAAGDQTNNNNNDVLLKLKCRKGRDQPIDMTELLLQQTQKMTFDLSVVLEGTPTNGDLVSVIGTGSQFKYSQKPYMEDGKKIYPVGVDAGERLAFTATYHAEKNSATLSSLKGILAIEVEDSPPVLKPSVTYVFDSEPAVVSLNVEDADALGNPNIDLDEEVTNSTIIRYPPESCGLLISQGNPIEYQFVPAANQPHGRECIAQFQVKDNSKMVSEIQNVTIRMETLRPPVASNHTYYITPAGTLNNMNEFSRIYYLDLSVTTKHNGNFVYSIVDIQPPTALVNFPGMIVKGRGKDMVNVIKAMGGKLPYVVYTGTKTRVVLGYESPLTPAVYNDVVLTYTVSDPTSTGEHRSDPGYITLSFLKDDGSYSLRKPRCGSTVYEPVFVDRPQRRIRLNYSLSVSDYGLNNTNMYIRYLKLMRVPRVPLGDLYYLRVFALPNGSTTEQWHLLGLGDTFSDKDGRLRYQVRPSAATSSGSDIFYYRAENNYGDVCDMTALGTIEFRVVQHEQQIMKKDGTSVRGRYESMRLGGIGLFRIVNVIDGVTYNNAVITSGNLRYGTMYRVSSSMPYTADMYNYSLNSKPLCDRMDCTRYFDLKIDTANPNIPASLIGDDITRMSPSEIRFFYQPSPDLNLERGGYVEHLTYRLESQSGRIEELRLSIYLTRGKLREIVVWYDPPRYRQDFTSDFVDEQLIEVKIPTPPVAPGAPPGYFKYAVLPFNMEKRHGVYAPFRLYQLDRNGAKITKGPQLVTTTFLGRPGLWIDQESTLVLVPRESAQQQKFSFRVKRYTVRGDKIVTTGVDLPSIWRIVVKRRNTPPIICTLSNFTTEVGKRQEIILAANDVDNDRISFLVTKAPQYGYIAQEVPSGFFFGSTTMRVVHMGERLRVPKWTGKRSTISVYYTSSAVIAGRVYPIQDFFEVAADDGGDVLSVPATVQITVNRGDSVGWQDSSLFSVSSSIIMTLLVMVLVGGLVVYVFRRRLKKYIPLSMLDV